MPLTRPTTARELEALARDVEARLRALRSLPHSVRVSRIMNRLGR